MDVDKLSALSHFLWKHHTYYVSGFYVNYEMWTLNFRRFEYVVHPRVRIVGLSCP